MSGCAESPKSSLVCFLVHMRDFTVGEWGGSPVTRDGGQVVRGRSDLTAETKQRATSPGLPRTKSHVCRAALRQVDEKEHGFICGVEARGEMQLSPSAAPESMLIMFAGVVCVKRPSLVCVCVCANAQCAIAALLNDEPTYPLQHRLSPLITCR